LVAGLGIALAMPALAMVAENSGAPGDRSSSLGWNSQALATQTTLTAETRDQGGQTQAVLAVAVTGEDGLPARGAIAIDDGDRQLAGVALNAQGQANVVLDLPAGDYFLRAVYAGDATHQASVSQRASVRAMTIAGTPDFQVTVAPLTGTFPLTLTPGDAGTVTITVTPVNNASLTAPMFVTLSCSGLPDQASCTATPENLEILSTTTTAPTSALLIQTEAASKTSVSPTNRLGKTTTPIAWAFLLPGALCLGGLAWGARRRRWLNQISLVALVGLVTLLGTTACNPRYYYENHGPLPNPPTPAGTYTVTVTAQSSNGVTATTHSTTFVLTVN
jgi:hypothetical protein